jgi:ATP-binding cassette subfamily B protein
LADLRLIWRFFLPHAAPDSQPGRITREVAKMPKYRLVKQADQSDCGAAALATVALHHNVRVGIQRLRDLAGTDRAGTNLLGLVGAAEKLGFSATAVKGPYDALRHVPLPAVAHIHTDEGMAHFVVLFRAGKRTVVIGDPARGVVKLPAEKFRDQWTGYLLLMTPRPDVDRIPGETPPRPWRRFLGLLAFQRSVLGEALVCALLITLLGLATSYFVQHLVDSVLVREERQLLNGLGAAMACVVLFRTLFAALRQYLLAHLGRKIDLGLISGYARRLLSLPLSFFEMRRVGEILSRVNDAGKIREAIGGAALTVAVDGAMVVFTAAVLWIYDVQLAAVATLFAPLLLAVILVHHVPAKRRARQSMEDSAQLSAHLVEDVSGVETIKAFGAQPLRIAEGESRLVRVAQSAFSLQRLQISMCSLAALVNGGAGIAVLWYGGHRVMDGALTVGELMFFYTLLGCMLGPLERLASVNLQIQDALVAVDRLYQIMDLDAEDAGPRKAKFRGVSRALELRNVSFRYGCRKNVLEEIAMRIPAGATVAVVGESGCGKSTLLKLLLRYYDPSQGHVLADGVDLRDFDLASLRGRIGLVSQDAFVFNGTVRDNIALGRPDAELNEIIAAARAADLDEFITSLPDRYETMIGERGANLSGGQRQRLAIARAILCKPEILLFDEATSHLDTATERAIQENLRTEFVNKTVVLVAHRLSTIRDADLIYVMHAGRIAEEGTHEELIAQGGRYAALWVSQTGTNRLSGAVRPAIPSRNGNHHPLATVEH